MAYVPPHKRHSKDAEKPIPTPELLTPQFKKNMTIGPSRSNAGPRNKKFPLKVPKNILYANDAVHKWLTVGLENDSHLLSVLRLEPIFIKAIEQIRPFMLTFDQNVEKDTKHIKDGLQSPWVSIAEHVLEDLLCSYENLKKDEGYEVDEMEIKLVARFGKLLFHGNQPVNFETEKSVLVDETSLRGMKRLFRTNVPISYMNYITDEIVSKIGLGFEDQKELYRVKVFDSNFPDFTISCKCRVVNDRLDLYKLEINHLRHMATDISCLNKDLDLRIMLWSKKNLVVLTDDEKKNINGLISSAVIDPSVKGGLRWSLGKDSSGERYKVVGVWHTTTKTFTSPSMRLALRSADRIDFMTLLGEVTEEVTLKMNGILSLLQEKNVQTDLVAKLLKENIKLIWDYFLCCDSIIN